MENQEKQNYFAVIIAPVLNCKDLEPNAKLLYGHISALSHEQGYCFASNAYFADKFEVENRTVQRWLDNLEEKKFIRRENGEGFGGQRKIFLCWDFQINFTERQKCHGGVTKMSGGGDKNVTHNNTSNKTSNNVVCVAPAAEAASPQKSLPETVTKTQANGKAYQYSISDLYSETMKHRKDWKEPELNEAWRIFVTHDGPINSPFAFCEGVIKNNRKLSGLKTIKEKEQKCQKKQDSKQQQKTFSEPTTDKDSSGQRLARLNYQNGEFSYSIIG